MAIYDNIINAILPSIPQNRRLAVQKNFPYVIQALDKEGILTPNVLAYALATVGHETAGTFEPIEEYGGRQQAIRLGYGGGENYYGRGFIQLTHKENYEAIGNRIGIKDLAEKPEKALDPEVSAKILAAFFKDRGVAEKAEQGNFVAARRPVNPDALGDQLASQAQVYLRNLQNVSFEEDKENGDIIKKLASPQLDQVNEALPSAQLAPPAQMQNFSQANTQIPRPSPTPQPAPPPIPIPSLSATPSPQPQNLQSKKQSQEAILGRVSFNDRPANNIQNALLQPRNPQLNQPPSMQAGTRSQALGQPGFTHTVKAGETPGGIAQRYLGNFNRWREIYQGNPRQMQIGAKLKIPTPNNT